MSATNGVTGATVANPTTVRTNHIIIARSEQALVSVGNCSCSKSTLPHRQSFKTFATALLSTQPLANSKCCNLSTATNRHEDGREDSASDSESDAEVLMAFLATRVDGAPSGSLEARKIKVRQPKALQLPAHTYAQHFNTVFLLFPSKLCMCTCWCFLINQSDYVVSTTSHNAHTIL